MTARRIWASLLTLFLPVLVVAQEAAPTGYKAAPPAIRKILDIPPPPSVSLSPTRNILVLAESRRYPPIADLARPVVRLAGLRIDPSTNGPQAPPRYTSLTLRNLEGGKDVRLELPPGARPHLPVWAHDGSRFAVLLTTSSGIDLYLGRPGAPTLRKVEGVRINEAFGESIRWLPGARTLVCKIIPPGRPAPPARPAVPQGPVIQESSGRAGPSRTYQDLLQSPHDEALFEYYCRSQLALVDAESGKVTQLAKPAMISSFRPSPDGKHLLVTRLRRPYSFVLPASAFPRTTEVWNLKGAVEHTVADLPLADNIPIDGVQTGPRNVSWRPGAEATLVWTEALDNGDPKKEVPHRDRLRQLAKPFRGEPVELARTEHRLFGLNWTEKGQALIADFDRETRRRRTFLHDFEHPETKPRLVWDRSIQDRYRDPGTPIVRRLPSGEQVIRQDGDAIFLDGQGASPGGNRPFLDRYDLKSGKTTRLFHCAAGSLEEVVDVLNDDGSVFLTRHQSPVSPPNYRVRMAGKEEVRAVTNVEDQTPELRKITRRLVRYKRGDGVALSFTLYLPPDYKEGTRLPTVVWAYPREFTDATVAGQVFGSTSQYTLPVGPSHLFFLLAGYAVLDGATMPVVGSAEKANDRFVEQIVSSARAAIDKAVELGVTDRDRVGVGGHSYGAFMTANLLAHSDLFRAGIARSGAYNRTLTPFGFQSERRTLWQAPEVYAKMSPFQYANRIKAPILLIHGQADDNSGTFPIQSERMYQAIRGNAGTVRYVSLPDESHGYRARESVEHTLAEMIDWFDRHVKEAPGRK